MTTEKNERMQFDVTFMSKARNNLALSTEKPCTRSRPLRAAYLGTGYWFSDDDGETHQMQIGGRPTTEMHGATGAAYITAWNPGCVPIGVLQNVMANFALLLDLKSAPRACSCPIYVGIGCDRALNWPPEASLMALGITLENATILGQCYGQNAFVWVDASGMPSLVELVDMGADIAQPEELLTWVQFAALVEEKGKSGKMENSLG